MSLCHNWSQPESSSKCTFKVIIVTISFHFDFNERWSNRESGSCSIIRAHNWCQWSFAYVQYWNQKTVLFLVQRLLRNNNEISTASYRAIIEFAKGKTTPINISFRDLVWTGMDITMAWSTSMENNWIVLQLLSFCIEIHAETIWSDVQWAFPTLVLINYFPCLWHFLAGFTGFCRRQERPVWPETYGSLLIPMGRTCMSLRRFFKNGTAFSLLLVVLFFSGAVSSRWLDLLGGFYYHYGNKNRVLLRSDGWLRLLWTVGTLLQLP